jgi:hypothetical protein
MARTVPVILTPASFELQFHRASIRSRPTASFSVQERTHRLRLERRKDSPVVLHHDGRVDGRVALHKVRN